MVSFEKWFLIIKFEDVEGVGDYDRAKWVSTMPFHVGSYILSHSQRLMNDVIKQIGGTIIIVFTTPILILCTYTKTGIL